MPDVLREVDYEFLRKECLQPFAALHEPVSLEQAAEDKAAVWRALAEWAQREVTKALNENKILARRALAAEDLLAVVQPENDDQYALYTAAREERRPSPLRWTISGARSQALAQRVPQQRGRSSIKKPPKNNRKC